MAENRGSSSGDAGSLNAAWESILEARLAEKQAGRTPPFGSGAGMQLSRLDVPEEGLGAGAVRDAGEQLLDMQMKLNESEQSQLEAGNRVQFLEEELGRLRSMTEVSDQMRRQAESDAAQLRTEGVSSDAPLEALKGERNAMEHDLAVARARVAELERERDEARARAEKFESELGELRSAAMGADRARMEAEAELAEVRTELESARAVEGESREELSAADARCAELEIAIGRLKGSAAPAETAAPDEGADALGQAALGQDEIDRVVGEFTRQAEGFTVGAEGTQTEELTARVEEYRTKLAAAEHARGALERRASEAERRVSQLEQSEADLTERLRSSEETRLAFEQRVNALDQEAVNLRNELAAAGGFHGANGQEVAVLRRKLDEAHGIIRAIEDAYLRGRSRRTRTPRRPR